MKAQTVLAIWILVFGVAVVQAQTGIWIGVGPAPRSGAMKDAPFSANLISINDRIDGQPGPKTEFHGKVARDWQGDTYFAMEHMSPIADGPRPMRVTITNPSELTVTTLDPESKTAFVSHVSAKGLATAPLLTPGASSAAPDGRPAGATAVIPPGTSTKTESLGTKDVDGLHLVGLRTVRTAFSPATDTKPFVYTVDTWTSPELKVVVIAETSTSNGDHHLTKLENIVRTEPSAALFQIPAGYSVRDNAPLATNMY